MTRLINQCRTGTVSHCMLMEALKMNSHMHNLLHLQTELLNDKLIAVASHNPCWCIWLAYSNPGDFTYTNNHIISKVFILLASLVVQIHPVVTLLLSSAFIILYPFSTCGFSLYKDIFHFTIINHFFFFFFASLFLTLVPRRWSLSTLPMSFQLPFLLKLSECWTYVSDSLLPLYLLFRRYLSAETSLLSVCQRVNKPTL